MNEIEIIECYKIEKSIYKVGKIFNIKPHAVWRLLKKNDIKIDASSSCRKYEMDESFFDIIDSEIKAYALGLIYADGNLFKNNCSITLVEPDSYVLLRISQAIFKDRPLIHQNRQESGNTDCKVLMMSSPKFRKALLELGVTERKSLTCPFPNNQQVPEEFIFHFIRGYFDGDGTIYQRKDKRFGNGFIGSDLFCRDLTIKLNNYKILSHLEKDGKVSRVIIGDKLMMKKLYDLMYKNATIFLIRKKSLYEKMILETNWIKLQMPKYSKQVGVTFDKRRKKWYTNIKRNSRVKFLGSFDTEDEAIQARINYEKI